MALFSKYCEQSTPINVRLQVVSLKIVPGDWPLLAVISTGRRNTLVKSFRWCRTEKAPLLELTYNWDGEVYQGGRNFGHLAYEVDDIYALCQKVLDQGITLNVPPADGHMAFFRSPDNISIELLQKGDALPVKEPWASMQVIGEW